VADRYCSNCGQELRAGGGFCPGCGRPLHETAHVPTPEADVPVPPLPAQAAGGSGGGRVSGAQSTRNALIALGVVILLILGVISLSSIPTAGPPILPEKSQTAEPEAPLVED
jgi:hypothetical protein